MVRYIYTNLAKVNNVTGDDMVHQPLKHPSNKVAISLETPVGGYHHLFRKFK